MSAALALGRKEIHKLNPNLLALGILKSLLITNSGLQARSKIPFQMCGTSVHPSYSLRNLGKSIKSQNSEIHIKVKFDFVSSFHPAGLISGLSSSSVKAHFFCCQCLWRGAISPSWWQCSTMWCYLCTALYYFISQFHDVTGPIFLTITAGSLPGFHLLHRPTFSGCIFGMDLLYSCLISNNLLYPRDQVAL